MTEEINKGCEFQSDCIEYKDISYLKVMPICAIHELSIACHDKVNKCKYYKLYKQLKRAEIEIEKLKGVDGSVHPDSAYYKITRLEQENKELKAYKDVNEDFKKAWDELNEKHKCYRSALEEIRNVLKEICKEECDYTKPKFCGDCDCRYGQILDRINEVLE